MCSWTYADKNSSSCSGPPRTPRPRIMHLWNLVSVILIGIFCDTVHVQGTAIRPADCCLHTSNKKIPYSIILRYEIQNTDKGCPRAAVVFFTKPSMVLCATPGLKWVEKAIKKLDHKKGQTKRKQEGDANDRAGSRKEKKRQPVN